MPANTAVYQRTYMKKYRAAGRERRSARGVNLRRPFVGCDGEGRNLPNGYHAYFMLRIGDELLSASGNNVRLTTLECLDFISRQDPDRIYVGYFFDYDVTMILMDLPWNKLLRLMNRNMRMGVNNQLFPVDYAGFQIDYLPNKEFKVRRMIRQEDDETVWSPWIVINDVGSFFQCAFLKTIETWKVCSEQEWQTIAVGKQARSTFDIKDVDDIAAYNHLETRLLEQVMDRFRDACIDAGYVPAKWQGPGLLAEAMLKAHNVPTSRRVPILQDNADLVSFATSAYYGGRTEVSIVGDVQQPVYQYDINSAYPYAMQFVPCLLHGEWTRVSSLARRMDTPSGIVGEQYALVYGTFTRKATCQPSYYGLPLRTKAGTIVFPEEGKGWYWSFEVDSAIHQTFDVEEAWVYRRTCKCQPLSFVRGVYETRRQIGKDGPGVVLKLGMNSLYGKTVQSIGSPKYANPIWGSFITAFPRMMIQNFIHSSPMCGRRKCGFDILMIATDSLATLSDRGHDYIESKELGGWSVELHPSGIFVVQPGVYFGSSGKPSKTRGVPRTFVEHYEPVFRDAFSMMVETGEMQDGDVAVPQQLFVGIRYALHRRNQSLLGQWIQFGEAGKEGKVISFDWTSKRAIYPALAPNQDRAYIQTFPYVGDRNLCTVPYSKDIGGLQERQEMRLPFEGQPDWNTGGFLEDGD